MGAVTYGSGRLSRGGALAQVFLSLTNQRPLVALHALQLLVSSHAATRRSCRWVHSVHQVQGTVRSGLLTPGGVRLDQNYAQNALTWRIGKQRGGASPEVQVPSSE